MTRLTARVPGKKFYSTCDILDAAGNVGIFHLGYAVADGYLDQVSPMWYDQCFPQPSPLYRSSTHSCYSNDSALATQIAAAIASQSGVSSAVAKAHTGLGYAIQVYTGCNTCYAYLNNYTSMLTSTSSTIYFDNESKERWLVNGSTTLAYEDTLTGYWKADFIKKYGFGGAMGFSIGYGYISNPPAGWDRNPAAKGVGFNLGINNGGTPITPLSPPALLTPGSGTTGLAPDSITLTWNTVSGATGYYVEVLDSTTSTSAVSPTRSATTSFAIPSGRLSSFTTYKWHVATDNGVMGSYSGYYYFTTKGGSTALAAPTLSTPSNGATNITTPVSFTWSSVTNATSYLLYLATNTGFTSGLDSAAPSTNSYSWSKALTSGQTYYWRVKGVASGISGAWSTSYSFTTQAASSTRDTTAPVVSGYTSTPTDTAHAITIYGTGSHNWQNTSGLKKWRIIFNNGAVADSGNISHPTFSYTASINVGLLSTGSYGYTVTYWTDSGYTATYNGSMSVTPVASGKWNTAHYANWDFGSGGNAGRVPYAQLPWQYITNMILFAGGTGGNQTNGTSPYYNVPGNLNDATTDSLVAWGRKFGVHIELDLGLGSGYNSLWNAGDAALQVWAHTVANIIVAHGYDGYDFDLEGMSGPRRLQGMPTTCVMT